MDHQSHKTKDTTLCWYFQQGSCRFGDLCKFRHEKESAVSNGGPQIPSVSDIPNHGQLAQRHTLPVDRKRIKDAGLLCSAWRAGACIKGERCSYVHDPEIRRCQEQTVQGATRHIQIAREEEEGRGKEQEHGRQAQLAQERAKREAEEQTRVAQQRHREEQESARRAREAQAQAAREAEERARAAEIAEVDAGLTLQSVVLGSVVTFGAGLDIRDIITGFESCIVRVRNLPHDARDHEIRALFTQQGIDSDRLLVVNIKYVAGGKQEATVVIDAESGQALAKGLDQMEFRDENLSFEVGVSKASDKMGVSRSRDTDVLIISWRAPCERFVVELKGTTDAYKKARELDKRILCGRRVKAEKNIPPPGGRILPTFHPNSIKLSNVPLGVSSNDIFRLVGDSAVIRRLNRVSYKLDAAVQCLQRKLEELSPGALRSFECTSGMTPVDGIICVRAGFTSWDEAKKARDHLGGQVYEFLGNTSFWLRLPNPVVYTVIIPVDQYRAQKKQWDALSTSIKDKKACNVHVRVLQGQRSGVRISVLGSVKEAVGAHKVRVETLAAGTLIEGWHAFFRGAHNPFLEHVLKTTGAYVRADWTRRRLKAYGEDGPVECARTMIKEELDRLAAVEWTVPLEKQSVAFFIREGLVTLKDTIGADNVRFDAATRMLTMTGGEEARVTLYHLIDKSLTGRLALLSGNPEQLACPICFDDVSHPVQLGCGHVYCTACLRHYLTSALDSDQFPLLCMGNESKCKTPIPIPSIKQFFTQATFERLVEVAFVTYLAKHPQDFVYCKTPDCAQIYRATSEEAATTLQCPACFATVCSGCRKDAHEGMSCAEHRLRDPAEQERLNEEWIRLQGGSAKRCPRCNVILWKDEGCNHMSCRCGAHICWRCMGVFTSETIYRHMTAEHGGIYDPGHPNNQRILVNYREQLEVLRQAELRRRRETEERARLVAVRNQNAELARLQEEARQRAAAIRREAIRAGLQYASVPVIALVSLCVALWLQVSLKPSPSCCSE